MSWRSFFSFRDDGHEVKSVVGHLEDLRRTVIKMAVVLVGAMALCFLFRVDVAAFVQRPLIAVDPVRAASPQAMGVADSFTISLELSFYGGMVLSFPLLLWFLAEFILPALNPREKRMLFPAAAIGFGLFLAGASFAYFVVLPQTLEFFFQDARAMNWQPNWTVREYYSFATQFVISFGLAFELPVVVLVLVKLGILNHLIMRRTRAFALLVIFFFAAIITPTSDIPTLVLMGAPMYILYEICIAIAWMMRERGGE